MKKRRKKRIIGTVLVLELAALLAVFVLVILNGNISFNPIKAEEASSQAGSNVLQPDNINSDQTKDSGNITGGTAEGSAGDTKDVSVNTGTDNNQASSGDFVQTSDSKGNNTDSTGKSTGSTGDAADNTDKAGSKDVYDTITVSAAGDVTLGRDESFGYSGSFDDELAKHNNDYSYFFKNVKDIFDTDDITVVNLETTLTTADKKAVKQFRFKADPSYVEILKQGSVEAVSIANNHSHDYLDKGYSDTIKTLKKADVGYFGYENTYIKEVRGIKVGFASYVAFSESDEQKKQITQAIADLKKQGAAIVIVMFHWGIERDYLPNSLQTELAHYTIDHGADLVLGGHPHVLQGIEDYKGKKIVYSLGNFSFGGNKNPDDKDTMVFVSKFSFKNGKLQSQDSEVIPCSISSVKSRNNYQPTPLTGSEKKRVLNKIAKYSKF